MFIIIVITMFCFYFVLLLLLHGLQQETYKVDLAAPCYSVLRPLFPGATCFFSKHLVGYKPAARSLLHSSVYICLFVFLFIYAYRDTVCRCLFPVPTTVILFLRDVSLF